MAVEKALDLYGAPVYVRKQIVHNRHVVETLEERGAIVQAGKNWQDQTSVSERLVTGQNPQSAKSVGRKVVELSQKLFRTGF